VSSFIAPANDRHAIQACTPHAALAAPIAGAAGIRAAIASSVM
jgi:hypothetical protein